MAVGTGCRPLKPRHDGGASALVGGADAYAVMSLSRASGTPRLSSQGGAARSALRVEWLAAPLLRGREAALSKRGSACRRRQVAHDLRGREHRVDPRDRLARV